ncbi:MAG: CRTAC1 family protein [Phycisphaerales bacterium]|nr:CRTAC1 family protein [Phycisphaerales bacterium]
MKKRQTNLYVCATGAGLTLFLSPAAMAQGPSFVQIDEQDHAFTSFVPAEDNYVGRHSLMSGGVSVGDFNNDGWQDMYLPGGGTQPDQLLINMGDGTFENQAAAWGVDRSITAMGSAVGDINRDGYPDLYVASFGKGDEMAAVGKCLLYLNRGPDEKGNFSFEEIGEQAGVNYILDQVIDGTGATFGDVDPDGHMDLVVSAWARHSFSTRIYRNLGDNTFEDITLQVMPDTGWMRGFTPKLIDLNGDRYPELLLANDFGQSRLFINDGKDEQGNISFQDATDIANISEDCNGMGASVADFNGDGLLDWFITNIYIPEEDCGNTLFYNSGFDESGIPLYSNQATESGVADSGWGWGTTAGDYDNDGDPDIVTTSGYSNVPLVDTRLFLNDGTGSFADNATEAGLGFQIRGRGMAQLDYDNDGDLDLVFVEEPGPTRIYRNDTDNGNHWLRLKLITRYNKCLAPMGTGTRVTAYAGDSVQVQVLASPTTYLGQSEMMIHFGFADNEVVERLEFEWADGRTTIMTDVQTNQILDVVVYHPADLTRDENINLQDIFAYLALFNAQDLAADTDENGSIDFDDVTGFIDVFVSGCP